ncbi:MAG: hypothetical protein JWP89_2182 [Schlesneria sp.]|nr:hypothetical protein [Schlesneria sp.]
MCNCHNRAADAQPNEQTPMLEQKTPRGSAYAAGRKFLAVLVPGLLWALIPKCPACLAAYIALATGLSVSVSVASHLRYVLIAIFLVTVSVLAWSQMRRWVTMKMLIDRKWTRPTI